MLGLRWACSLSIFNIALTHWCHKFSGESESMNSSMYHYNFSPDRILTVFHSNSTHSYFPNITILLVRGDYCVLHFTFYEKCFFLNKIASFCLLSEEFIYAARTNTSLTMCALRFDNVLCYYVYPWLQSDLWLRGQMLEQLASYAGPTETDTVSEGWNTLFMKVLIFSCFFLQVYLHLTRIL